AVVENPSDEDWKDVRMALVSGRPISFQMNLYDPLYVSRPVVEPELFASLRPVAYSGGLDSPPRKRIEEAIRDQERAMKELQEAKKDRKPADGKGDAKNGEGKSGDKYRNQDDAYYKLKEAKELDERMDLGRHGGQSMATGAKLGDFFQYAIDKPVSLARQKSAMLPIVNKDVEGSRVSIYNERTQAKFPLLGLKLKNTSGLHLMQGPITVFEGSNYAGDARILDLQPNEERLISYAVDLGTEVNPVPSTDNGRITKVKAAKGVIWTETKGRESKTYTVVNRNDQERLVLVEHPERNDFKLVDMKPAETASDVYRFEVKVPAGASKNLVVTEERNFGTSVQLSNSNDEQIRFFMNQPVSSAKVKDGLKQALELRQAVSKTRSEINELQRQLNVITEDQKRLRANLK